MKRVPGWFCALVTAAGACGDISASSGDGSTGLDLGPMEGASGTAGTTATGGSGETEPDGDNLPPGTPDEPQCEARWLDNPDPRVRLDAELDCSNTGFADYGFSVASAPGMALVTASGSSREWVVRVSADAVEHIPGGPQGMRRQRVLTTVDADGRLLLAGTVGVASSEAVEVWELGEEWQRVAEAVAGPGSLVRDLDASANGDVAVWIDVDGAWSVAHRRDGWELESALGLDMSVLVGHAFGDELETALGYNMSSDGETAALLSRTEDQRTVQLGDPMPGPVEVLLPIRARAHVFGAEEPRFAALAGTQHELRVVWAGGVVSLPAAAMASARCPYQDANDHVEGPEACEDDCSEEGAGRFNQAVSAARADDGTLLIAYVHGDTARHFEYKFSCLNPDGAYCWCETRFWGGGSSFELHLVAVRTDGSQEAVLTAPLEGVPQGRDPSSPGDILDIDAQGDQVAIAVKLGHAPMRVLVIDGADGGFSEPGASE